MRIVIVDLVEIGWGFMYSTNMSPSRDKWLDFVNTSNKSSGSIKKCLKILEYLSDCWLLRKD
jgi:hypothetical protein